MLLTALLALPAFACPSDATAWPILALDALPATPWEVDGLQVVGTGLADLDGDGQDDWIIRYTLTEPPRAAVGSWVHEVFAVYRLPDLALLWTGTTRRVGGASEPALACSAHASPDGRGAALVCLTASRERDEAEPPTGALTCDRWRPKRGR